MKAAAARAWAAAKDNLPASAWIRDAQFRYTFVNRRYAETWGDGEPRERERRRADCDLGVGRERHRHIVGRLRVEDDRIGGRCGHRLVEGECACPDRDTCGVVVGDIRRAALAAAVNIGYVVRPRNEFEGSIQDDALRYGAAAKYTLFDGWLTPIAEVRGELDVFEQTAGAEVLLAANSEFQGFSVTLGAGPGFGPHIGTPDVRGFLDVSFTPGGSDLDKDGIPDSVDSCPTIPEDMDGVTDGDGCADPDNDGDGLADAIDRCPDEAEDKDGFQDNDGCPELDNDGDGVADVDDWCKNQAEDRDGFEDDDACPEPDNDGDGINDDLDECPMVAETPNGFRDDDGCADERPSYVFDEETPVILYSIKFQPGSDELLAESHPVLDEVAKSLEVQEDVRVRIEGHTDDVGSANANLALSQRRALTVLKYLVGKGVAPDRLEYEGYGQTQPLVDNVDEQARSKNRRVEFRVVP